jgi:hypothetical protein
MDRSIILVVLVFDRIQLVHRYRSMLNVSRNPQRELLGFSQVCRINVSIQFDVATACNCEVERIGPDLASGLSKGKGQALS